MLETFKKIDVKMILSIEFLKTFLAAVEAGSFTQAAAVVHRTQSAVSMQMKRLEEEIGKPLFVRNRKMLVLTDAGELLLFPEESSRLMIACLMTVSSEIIALDRDYGMKNVF